MTEPRLIERCWKCFQILPFHATPPHVLPGRLVFIRIREQELKGEAKGVKP